MARQAKTLRMTVIAGVLLGFGTVAADAATLGYQQILSKAGEPLQIDIPVTNVSAVEADGLKASLAARQAFESAGVVYSPDLANVKLSLEKVLGDRYVIHVTSSKPVSETFLDAIIVLEWRAGRQSFIYTLFANPENTKIQVGPVIAPSVAAPAPSQALPAPKTGTVAPAKPLPPPVPAVASKPASKPSVSAGGAATPTAASRRYTVQKGDTLSGVADLYSSDVAKVTPEQMMFALYQANRHAFIDGDPNRIKLGATLKVPDGAQVQAVTEPSALRFAVQTREEFQAYRGRVAEGVAHQRVTDTSGRSAGGAIEQSRAQQTVPAAPRDELKLSRADAKGKPGKGGVGEVDQIARDKALAESQARVAELEKNVAELQKLLALKNQALAALQQPSAASGATAESGQPATAKVAATQGSSNATSADKTPGSRENGASALPAPAKANLSTWDKLRQSPYTWPGVVLALILLGVGWLIRRGRKPASSLASIGQDGPFDTGDAEENEVSASSAATAQDRLREQTGKSDGGGFDGADVRERRIAQATGEAALAGAAAYATHQAMASDAIGEGAAKAAGRDSESSLGAAPQSVVQAAGNVDLSLPGVPDGVGALQSAHMADQTEDHPWGSVKFTMAPESSVFEHPDGKAHEQGARPAADEPETPAASPFGSEPASAAPLKPLSFDLSGFNLDLKDGASEGESDSGHEEVPVSAPGSQDGFTERRRSSGTGETLSDIDTKLELAAAYVEIGDDGGARELLEEVLRDGNEVAKAEARKRLAALG